MTAYEVEDVVLVLPAERPAIVTAVMTQEEGPAYWVEYLDTGESAVVFHEEVAQR